MATPVLLIAITTTASVFFTHRFRGKSQFCEDVQVGLSDDMSADRVVVPSDAEMYAASVEQYAYTSLPNGTMHPSGIVYPEDVVEVQKIVQYAKVCGFKVSVRSGGHQYSGLSSCNSSEQKCIQIDMSRFTDIAVQGSSVNVGVGVSLATLYATLAAQGVFVAGGECSGVFVGGHAQTGGAGAYSRAFGYVADNVLSFEMVVASGAVKRVTQPTGRTNPFSLNDQLFWAVLGGNAGSWGVVTSYELKARRDADYPQSTYYTCIGDWSRDGFRAVAKVISEMVSSSAWQMDSTGDESVFLTTFKRVPVDTNVIHVEGVWPGVGGKAFDDKYFRKFQQALSGTANLRCFATQLAPSRVLRDYLTFYGAREFPFPYMKTVRGTKRALGDDALAIFAQKLDAEMTKPTSGVFPVHQLATFAGEMNTAENVQRSALPHRDLAIILGWAAFYSVDLNSNAKSTANSFVFDTWIEQFQTTTFKGKDYRVGWGTFGDVSIENTWQYFWDANTFFKLRAVKSLVDPTDVFRTKFTIPPLTRKC